MADNDLSFEEAFTELEKTIQALEAGGLSLDEAVALFETGMRLVKLCHERLNAAELRISRLQSTLELGIQTSDSQVD